MANNRLFVITGGPGTGKTSVINKLSKKFKVIPEAAREVGENNIRFKGKSTKEINHYYFQREIFNFQKKEFSKIMGKRKKIIFSDRGFGDTLAYYKFHNLKVPKEEYDYAKKFRFSGVFILDFLDFYEKDKLRQENKKEQKKIHKLIINMYKQLGYEPIIVPFMNISKRVNFILSKVNISKGVNNEI